MAHFAQIDESGVVTRVIVVNNSDILDENGNESEQVGKNFCSNLLGGEWIQTSYNSKFRKHYAGIGYSYDHARDAFIPKKQYPSWVLDESTCTWVSPIPMPNDGEYFWDEEKQNWEKSL
jgi:hypothetical protein